MMKPGEQKLAKALNMPPLSVREEKRRAELEEIVTKNFNAFYAVGCALKEIRETKLYRIDYWTFDDYCIDLWDMCSRRAEQHIAASKVVDNLIAFTAENPKNPVSGDYSELDQKNANHGSHFDILSPENEELAAVETNGGEKSAKVSNDGEKEPDTVSLSDAKKTSGVILNSETSNSENRRFPQNERQARILAKLPPEQQPIVWQTAVEAAGDEKITAKHIRKTIRSMTTETVKAVVKAAKDELDKTRKEKTSKKFIETYNAFYEQVSKERLLQWRNTDKKAVLRHLKILYTVISSEIEA